MRVEVVETSNGYQLLRGGEPYVVRGAGMGVDDIARFASHGGNSIRTWTTVYDYQDARSLLDKAHEHGALVYLHVSEIATPYLLAECELGVDIINCGPAADLADVRGALTGKCCFSGNLDPIQRTALREMYAFQPDEVDLACLPLFALFSAGVVFDAETFEGFPTAVSLGVIFGLVLGKPLGVLLTSWLVIRIAKPDLGGLTLPMLLGAGCLAGIGFTMAIFISELAYASETLINQAKVGVLIASALAALLGALVLHFSLPRRDSAAAQ